MTTTTYSDGDRVRDTHAPERVGTVTGTFADGAIVRVRWDNEFRRPDRERGERGRQPYVSDIGAVRLTVAIGPMTAMQALRADGGNAFDERAARLAFERRAIVARLGLDR